MTTTSGPAPVDELLAATQELVEVLGQGGLAAAAEPLKRRGRAMRAVEQQISERGLDSETRKQLAEIHEFGERARISFTSVRENVRLKLRELGEARKRQASFRPFREQAGGDIDVSA